MKKEINLMGLYQKGIVYHNGFKIVKKYLGKVFETLLLEGSKNYLLSSRLSAY